MSDFLTPARIKFINAASGIIESPDEVDRGYLARELVQCTLPHRDPGEVMFWRRTNGNFTLGLQPHIDIKLGKSVGLPYGSIPRLLLFWITSEAVRTKSRRIELGNSLSDFLRQIGLSPATGRGKRGDAKRLKEQMMRLFRCKISFDYDGTKENGSTAWLDMQVAPKGEFWWDFKNPDQNSLFESYLELGESFFEAITAAPVPLDFRALKALKQSPLALDVYAWTVYRVHRLSRTGGQGNSAPEIRVSFTDLKKQFGAEYNRMDNFRAAIKEAFGKVQTVFPGLDYTATERHIVLRPGATPIPAKAGAKSKTALPRKPETPSRDLSGVFDKAREAAPGWDLRYLEGLFWGWAEKEFADGSIKNPEGLFLSFCKKHYQLNGRP